MTKEISGWFCSAKVYEYKNILFELNHVGPWPLKKDYSLKKLAGRTFYKLFYEFDKLLKEEQEKFRIGGGCQRF